MTELFSTRTTLTDLGLTGGGGGAWQAETTRAARRLHREVALKKRGEGKQKKSGFVFMEIT